MLKRVIASVVGAVMLVGNAEAARQLASIFIPKGNGADYPTVELYYSACGEDERHECVIARFICGEYGGLSFVMGGFSDQEIGRWFTMSGATAILKSGQNVLLMRPIKIEFGELDGDWIVTFLPSEGGGYGDGKSWLRSLGESPNITIINIQDDMRLPEGPNDRKNMTAFVSACLK